MGVARVGGCGCVVVGGISAGGRAGDTSGCDGVQAEGVDAASRGTSFRGLLMVFPRFILRHRRD